ncbi:TetR/AcrR family transcriptional regulator [Parageobacillus thermoglucosidasius]|uniref:TetR family transcriptional regulator n=1 Tax=Parageobacillus thermoglucosidasius TaxID=1426 RepID=A0A1B7KS64_PARTM|nr:TetR/AcrR family transcriptional regulator [Parageobacillus thermoglucosidasius]OAT72898.1 TetR family transcriptional regulator [Parageobacillus thermoglucosidasius]
MKEKIIETSIELFDRKGFKETSVQEIVEAMGVTKGAFYYYFKSKEELLRDICLTYIEDLLQQQERILRDENKDCTTKLYEIVYMLIHNIRTRRKSARIFFREMRHLHEEHLQEIKAKRRAFRENYQKLIEEGIAEGEFKQTHTPHMVTFGILGITNWSYYWFNPDGEISEEKLAEIYVDLILNGIKNRDGK